MNERVWVGVAVVALAAACGCDRGGRNSSPKHDAQTAHGSNETAPVATPSPVRKIEVKENRWPSGALASRIEGYVDEDGKFIKHGIAAEWYENDQPKMEIHWKDGVQHGPRLTWHENGQIWGKGAYVNGIEDGTWSAWMPSGFKSVEWTMRMGAFHGMYTEWHTNGEKRREFEYINGQKQGPVTYWDDEGNVVSKGEYVNDVLQP